jgi:hypothetical protein
MSDPNRSRTTLVPYQIPSHPDVGIVPLIDGWMSPRMREMLSITADLFDGGILECDVEQDFEDRKATPLKDCMGLTAIEFLPSHVLEQNARGLYKSFWRGWGQLFQAMARLLRRGDVPTVSRVYDEATRHLSFSNPMVALNYYLKHGGRVQYAIDALLTTTMKVLLQGDYYWEYEEYRHEVEAHPPAMPWDMAFPIAWAKCMELAPEDPLISMGPYDHSVYH